MKPIEFNILRNDGRVVAGQPVSIGVPLPENSAVDADCLYLQDQDGSRIPGDITELQRWPDGSLRWVLVRFSLSDNYGLVRLCLAAEPPVCGAEAIELVDTDTAFKLSVGEHEFTVDRTGANVLPAISRSGSPVWTCDRDSAGVSLLDDTGSTPALNVQSIELQSVGRYHVEWQVSACFEGDACQHVKLDLHFMLSASKVLVCRCVVHNSSRAEHPGGIWDLGDKGSFCFREMGLRVGHGATELSVRSNPGESWREVTPGSAFALRQDSSGGLHSDSPVHVNARGVVSQSLSTQASGYRLEIDGSVVEQGARCSPSVSIQTVSGQRYQTAAADFWQNFPYGCYGDSEALVWQVFPAVEGEEYELQGGERKSQELYFSFGERSDALDWVGAGASVLLSPGVYQQSRVLRYLDDRSHQDDYDGLLEQGLCQERGFLAKREAVDEYGWRHFGEIYADHEAAFYTGDGIFVSHYNNQYDPIYGFARRLATTGDPVWLELMQSLARHVLDIDIYRTELDRAEYNNGLFWHTDHYKQAFTCTHRTFSRHQYTGQSSGGNGGGPGPEHCYTTGLKNYYLMTGQRDAADAVLSLADWITTYYEGTGTLIEQCKRAGSDFKLLSALLRGKKLYRYEYPLNRGVGNYIRALIDSYELTADIDYLNRAEAVIRNTFGPKDDISMRDLESVESTWFYTVFLQEVLYYLHVKSERKEFDSGFQYARQSLLHYADWMAEHERPSLEAKGLEYPNDTWVAQDIRKVEILYGAYCLASDRRGRFLERARFFRDYVVGNLQKSNTAHYARIQIILLQNHGPSRLLDKELPAGEYDDTPIEDGYLLGTWQLVRRVSSNWIVALLQFSPRREVRWLKARMS